MVDAATKIQIHLLAAPGSSSRASYYLEAIASSSITIIGSSASKLFVYGLEIEEPVFSMAKSVCGLERDGLRAAVNELWKINCAGRICFGW